MDEKSLPITPEASFKWETWSLMGMIPLSSILSFDLIPFAFCIITIRASR